MSLRRTLFRPVLLLLAMSLGAMTNVAALAGQPQLNVFIVGHTDNQGAYDYNLDLSRRRAEAVAAELVKNFRIAQARLRTAGVGFLSPVGSNANDAGRALNRRVELVAP